MGPSAALKTLEIMSEEKTWIKLKNLGIHFRKNFKLILKKHSSLVTFGNRFFTKILYRWHK